jgi:hypothetical protein
MLLAFALAVPLGWSETPDGPRHEASGIVCPLAVETFTLQGVVLNAEPRFLGICQYAAEDGRAGAIRVRAFVRGAGETNQAIRNDLALMEPEDGKPPPEMTARSGSGDPVDGRETSMLTITIRRGALLVDCQATAFRDGPPSNPSNDVSGHCFRLTTP